MTTQTELTTVTTAWTVHHTRLGNLAIEASDIGLVRVAFSESDTASVVTGTGAASAHVAEAASQIDEYLAGGRETSPSRSTGRG